MPAKQHRIVRGDDFRRIVRKGSRVSGAYCITHAVLHIEKDAPARFGFIVSKAVGNAVTRNLVRRRLKTIVDRQLAQGFNGADVVFRVLPAAAHANFAALEQEAERSLGKVMRALAEATR